MFRGLKQRRWSEPVPLEMLPKMAGCSKSMAPRACDQQYMLTYWALVLIDILHDPIHMYTHYATTIPRVLVYFGI